MYELTYTSTARFDVNYNMLEDIMQISQRNNRSKNISGLLIFDGQKFCQILEGDKNTVEETYDRIQLDERHENLSVFHSGEIAERSFSEWSMSFKWCQEQVHVESWMDWLAAQKVVSDFSSHNSLGCRILKLINGTAIVSS